jgi:uncharacterized protein YecE (DUF72 family)
MLTWYLGTMGFSWKEWKGVFYPDQIETRSYLEYYSQFFNAVEIDSTFYGTPRPSTVVRWAEVVPEGFKICAKLPREITHDKRLIGAQGALAGFLNVMEGLADKLGVLLIQLPPSFNIEEYQSLKKFLDELPGDFTFAVEVRHRSWHHPKIEELMASRRVAWAATEYEDLPMRIYPTTDFLYLRFIGRHNRFAVRNREQIDVSENLLWWKEQVLEHSSSVHTVYGFFNNDYSGFAAGTANRFKEMLDLPAVPFEPPDQPRLF